jgi:hypothetical protein
MAADWELIMARNPTRAGRCLPTNVGFATPARVCAWPAPAVMEFDHAAVSGEGPDRGADLRDPPYPGRPSQPPSRRLQ